MPKALFDHITHEYEQGRPSYPEGVFVAIETVAGPLRGRAVIEGGAGTGIASRQLAARGSRLVSFDISRPMLERARRPDEPPFVVADGATLPFRSESADVMGFAQAWHWLDHERASAEVARVLRPGGTWAAWWSHARADGEPWFEAYRALLAEVCPVYDWAWRDQDWGATLLGRDRFSEPEVACVDWELPMTIDGFLVNLRSLSTVGAMPAGGREALLAETRSVLIAHLGDRAWSIAHDTQVWTARRIA